MSPQPGRSPTLRAGASILLGGCAVLAFSPVDWYPLAWVTLGALYLLLQSAARPRDGAWIGFCFGLGYFLAGTSWIFVSLSVFGGLPSPLAALATLLFCAAMALYPALAGALVVRWRHPSFSVDALLFASIWALSEWLRGWLLTGFPWLSIGYSQTPPSPLAGYAPLLGVYGVSLVSALAGVCLTELLRRGLSGAACGAPRRRFWGAGPLLAACALLAAGGVLTGVAWTTPRDTPLRVALLQGNVPQDLKWRPEKLQESLAIYHGLMQAHPATLTVLPETALPTFLDALPRPYLETLLNHVSEQRGDVLFGIAVGDAGRYANAAVSFGDSPTHLYAKSHLVPFGEFVPPGFKWFLDMMRIPMSDFFPGPARQSPMEIAGEKIAVNICYEDVFGGEIIRALPDATLLINLSNTAWFGDSLAQPQHLQIARMRALETGRPMLRATNTGMTAVVLPDGSVPHVLPPFTRAGLVAEVHGYTGETPFVRWGNWLVVTLAMLLLAVAAMTRKTK